MLKVEKTSRVTSRLTYLWNVGKLSSEFQLYLIYFLSISFAFFVPFFQIEFDSFSGRGYARDYWCKRSSRKPMLWIEQVWGLKMDNIFWVESNPTFWF